ncbi:MAG: tRNA dihydrouridine(20/20a) synthase DusA, partial [Micavibrio aeruginosavorus]
MNKNFRISVAPMMDWTDRHCRYFHRLLSPNAVLYTEMVTTGALLFGDAERHLRFSAQEHPVALQLGGSEPDALSKSAKMGEDFGYDEINLNCGCPSDRVQKGKFGACLMAEPELVADCISAMAAQVKIPVTVKCRIGIDDSEDYEFLNAFIEKVKAARCQTFIIHARKAWLKGLSPKENREIPPLNYDLVTQIKNNHSDLTIDINGGLNNLELIKSVSHLDGAMIGREAYQNPFFLAEIEHGLNGLPLPNRFDIARAMIPYI